MAESKKTTLSTQLKETKGSVREYDTY